MTSETETTETEIAVDHIEIIYQAECPSISGRSTLTYAIGRHKEDGTLHLAIIGNTGGGMLCSDFASAKEIQSVVMGDADLTAKSFHCLHPGKSINTGGFILAALVDLGLIRAREDNSRVHEHVPTATFEKVAMARIGKLESKPVRKKGKA
jgi:hypothetical protein